MDEVKSDALWSSSEMNVKFAIYKSIVQRHGMTTVGFGQAYISFEKENNSNLSEYGQRDYR